MAQLGQSFDHESVEAGQGFDLMPPHECMAQIVESEVGPTKAGTGMIAKFTLELLDGDYTGRKIWDNVNFQNPNPQAQTIGQQRLKAYCEAAGIVGHLEDTEDLHFRPLRIKVGLSKPQEGYEQRNEVKGVKSVDASSPPAGKAPVSAPKAAPRAPAPRQASAPPPAAKPAGSRPWGNRQAAAASA